LVVNLGETQKEQNLEEAEKKEVVEVEGEREREGVGEGEVEVEVETNSHFLSYVPKEEEQKSNIQPCTKDDLGIPFEFTGNYIVKLDPANFDELVIFVKNLNVSRKAQDDKIKIQDDKIKIQDDEIKDLKERHNQLETRVSDLEYSYYARLAMEITDYFLYSIINTLIQNKVLKNDNINEFWKTEYFKNLSKEVRNILIISLNFMLNVKGEMSEIVHNDWLRETHVENLKINEWGELLFYITGREDTDKEYKMKVITCEKLFRAILASTLNKNSTGTETFNLKTKMVPIDIDKCWWNLKSLPS
jgi:hypothetical protein